MKRIPDRKKERWEYLRKKWSYYLLALVLTAFGVAGWYAYYHFMIQNVAIAIGFMGLVTTVGGWVFQSVAKMLQSATRVPYVPPVIPSTVPAEEVLVRGAQEPTGRSEMLLRATVKSEETKAEELLRVTAGATGERDR